jgi:DNA mismatch repair protein MSH6
VFTYKLTNGVAASSFGTHVASLAGVPLGVVNRAEMVSRDFAKQFQTRMAKKRQEIVSKLPLTAQADFAYLFRLAVGDGAENANGMGEERTRRAHVLQGLKATAQKYLPVPQKHV